MDFRTYHSQGLCARVNIVKPRFDSTNVSSKLLVDAVVSLRHYFIGVVNEAATEAGHPGSSTSTTLSPAVHTFAVKRHLGVIFLCFRKIDMLGLTS